MSAQFVPFQHFLSSKLEVRTADMDTEPQWSPSITLSRQAGARAVTIGEKLTKYLQTESVYRHALWTLFDQNLVQTIIEDHHLKPEVEQQMDEDRVRLMVEAVREVFKVKPSDWSLFNNSVNTIRNLCRLGHAIVVGRGGNFISADLPNTFSVRLVGSLAVRQAHLQRKFGLNVKAAAGYIHEKDVARRRYVKSHLQQDIDEAAGYHLILNTDDLADDSVVKIIAQAMEEWASGPANQAQRKPLELVGN
ncbi:MAG: hypothetical protein GWQ08_16015 [Verrucomicrobiaceae bacterium]|nr:hypothetical protein [Verrucomicrobiaceae bacterium]